MPKPQNWVSDVKADEVSLVDSEDNPPALFVLAKRKAAGIGQLYQYAIDAVSRVIGRDPGPGLRKQMYDEVRAGQSAESTLEVLDRRISALTTALWGTIYFPDDGVDVVAALAESISQFSEETIEDLPEIVAGRIMKVFGERDAPPTEEEFGREFRERFAELVEGVDDSRAGGPGDAGKETDDMFQLSKLKDEERAELAKGLVELIMPGIQEQIATLAKANEPKPDPKPGGEPTEAELLKSAKDSDPVLAKLYQAQERRHEAENKQRDDLIKRLVEKEETATLAAELKVEKLSKSKNEIAAILRKIDDDGVRTDVRTLLEAANSAIDLTQVTKQFGVNESPAEGSAAAKVEAKIAELRKVKPDLSHEEAYSEVLDANRDLYDQLQAEQN